MYPTRIPALALALACVAGCSSTIERVDPVPQSVDIGVYEASPPGQRKYVQVRRVWTGQWRSVFGVPLYGAFGIGAADLRNQAVALGGNAVINFGCYPINPASQPELVCNGTVVRFAE